MSAFLNLTDPGVRAALRHPALAGKKRIGRGGFCAVYDNGDTVLKLTADGVAHDFAASAWRPQGEHFPRLVDSHFCIGETSGGDLLYLYEAEKLQPIGRDSLYHIKKAVKDLNVKVGATYANQEFRGHNTEVYNSSRACEELAQNVSLPDTMRDAFSQLATFIASWNAALDFHSKNVMLRGDTIVLNDPIVGADAIKKYRDLNRKNRFGY
jgi:hypothetical protein